MTQYIDFLPDSHRSKQKRRRTLRWRQTVAVVFLAIIVAGGVRQRRERIRTQDERDQLTRQVAMMQQQLEDPATLRNRIAVLDRKADLVTNLRLRTPPTRVLYAVTNSLPQFVSLTEYRSAFANPKSTSKGAGAARNNKSSPKGSPVERDLNRIRQERNQRPLVVTIKGLAANDLSISQFLSKLQSDSTFDDVRLLYTDQAFVDRYAVRGFEIRMQVRTVGADNPHPKVTVAGRPKTEKHSIGRSQSERNRS